MMPLFFRIVLLWKFFVQSHVDDEAIRLFPEKCLASLSHHNAVPHVQTFTKVYWHQTNLGKPVHVVRKPVYRTNRQERFV